MNGYSKMRANAPNSKSVDFSTFKNDYGNNPPSCKPQDEAELEGERFGVILSRNCSSASQRFGDANGNDNERSINGVIGGVVRRAFSMRKSSSLVGDGYWRIHDTCYGDDQVIIEEEGEEVKRTIRKNKKGRIFRACNRFFKYS